MGNKTNLGGLYNCKTISNKSMKNIFSIKSIFIFLTCLITFSCVDNSVEPENDGNVELTQFQIPANNIEIHTLYIEWYSDVTRLERKAIRDSYRDPKRPIIILIDELCDIDRDVEIWVISFDPSPYPNCCIPDPKVIIKDNEGEMSKVSYLDLCND